MAFVVAAVLALLWPWAGRCRRAGAGPPGSALVLAVANIALIATGRSAHVALLVYGRHSAGTLLMGAPLVDAGLVPLVGPAWRCASSPMVRERFTQAVGEVDTARGRIATSETSMGLRLVIWPTTLDLIRQRPVLGYGVGGFAPAYAQLIHQRYSDWRAAEAKDTHNQYLHVIVEAGLPGVAAFLLFLWGVVRQPVPGPYRGVALALFAAWLVTSLFNSHFQTFAEAHLISLVLGALLGAAPRGALPAAQAAPAGSLASTAATASAT